MSDLGETFKAFREFQKAKKQSNASKSVEILNQVEIDFEIFNGGNHLRLKEYDFWPSTGMFMHRITGKKGRGVFNLIKKVKP